MSSYTDIYTSNSLKAADLKGKRKTVTVSEVEVKDFNDGKKLVLHFEKTEKTFVLNRTNAATLGGLLGEDYRKWAGHQIALRPDITNYPAPNTPCVRVDMELPEQKEPVEPQPKATDADEWDEENPVF